MSFCTSPIDAAKIAVSAPTTATVFIDVGASTNRAFDRATMYTPAVTMVAAWIKADTGVGPSIASGSHTYSGSCADFPQAPTNSSKVAAVMYHSPVKLKTCVCAYWLTSVKRNDPHSHATKNIPRRNPASPMRLTMNALFAASLADFLWKYNPISRYEHNPTPSHPTNSST